MNNFRNKTKPLPVKILEPHSARAPPFPWQNSWVGHHAGESLQVHLDGNGENSTSDPPRAEVTLFFLSLLHGRWCDDLTTSKVADLIPLATCSGPLLPPCHIPPSLGALLLFPVPATLWRWERLSHHQDSNVLTWSWYGINCAPPDSTHMWKPYPKCDSIWRQAL